MFWSHSDYTSKYEQLTKNKLSVYGFHQFQKVEYFKLVWNWESQFLGRLIRSPESLRWRKGSGDLKKELASGMLKEEERTNVFFSSTFSKRFWSAVLGCNLKNNRMISAKLTIQYHSNPSQCTQKRCPFHYRGLKCKRRKSRNTWRNRQIWPWSTEWSRAKTNSVLPRERTGHSKQPLPTTQEKTLYMDITRWSIPKSD